MPEFLLTVLQESTTWSIHLYSNKQHDRYQLDCSALPINSTQRRRRSPTVGAALRHCTTFHKYMKHNDPVSIRYVKKKFSAMVILTNIRSRYLDEVNKERGDQVAV
jgi:hypothetical protein